VDEEFQTKKSRLATMYGAGLRVSEVVGLKVSDLDRERHVIWVRGGKGHKDRLVMLAEPLREVLAAYWRVARPYFVLVGIDKRIESSGINQSLLDEQRLKRLYSEGHIGRDGLVLVVGLLVIHF
jgi:site-specific recombinase XerD